MVGVLPTPSQVPLCDIQSASTLEKTILMCIERIERLEEQLDMSHQEIAVLKKRVSECEEKEKEYIIRDLLVMEPKCILTVDIFGYLLGVHPERRTDKRVDEFIIDVLSGYSNDDSMSIPERVQYLYSLLRDTKPPWDMTSEDFSNQSPYKIESSYGSNIYTVLQAMTLEELKGFWDYRLQWTHCVMNSDNTQEMELS